MNKEKIKVIIAWIFLITLIALFLYVNHIKFFRIDINENSITETPVENSKAEAIELALTNITTNFNNNPLIEQYKNEGINLNATLNNYSIYITYETDTTTTTYEFNYSNLMLSINVTNEEDNIIKFNKIYDILIRATQQRLDNEIDLTNIINSHLSENINYNGLIKKTSNNKIEYSMDITKKLEESKKEGSE